MKGPDAICPESGGRLGRERHPDERGRPHREPMTDESDLLSTGAATSSTQALRRFFRRTAEAAVDSPSADLLARGSHHLGALRSQAPEVRDEWIWYALAERLSREDYSVAWMRQYVDPVCPHCGSELAVDLAPRGDVLPTCAVNCRDDSRFVAGDIAQRVRETYNRAFADRDHAGIDSTADLQTISP